MCKIVLLLYPGKCILEKIQVELQNFSKYPEMAVYTKVWYGLYAINEEKDITITMTS